MKKKFREITVDNQKYTWSIKSDHDEGILIRLWKDRRLMREIYLFGNIQITPGYISQLIKNQQ